MFPPLGLIFQRSSISSEVRPDFPRNRRLQCLDGFFTPKGISLQRPGQWALDPWIPETHTHQNGIWSCKLSLHGKTNIFKNMTKYNTCRLLLSLYRRAVVKQDLFMAHLLSERNSVSWRMRFRIHRYVAAPAKESILHLYLYILLFASNSGWDMTALGSPQVWSRVADPILAILSSTCIPH